jgi:hypothetical protein
MLSYVRLELRVNLFRTFSANLQKPEKGSGYGILLPGEEDVTE